MFEEMELEARERLKCGGRPKLPRTSFLNHDLLYVAFPLDQLDERGKVKTEVLRFPDLSCNWSRFSDPKDVKFRDNGKQTDGCLAFKVADVEFEEFAVVVHDPICQVAIENYSHCEVRMDPGNLGAEEEPPRGQKKGAKSRRNAWRSHIALNAIILVEPDA